MITSPFKVRQRAERDIAIPKICELYLKGKSRQEIANAVGFSAERVKKILYLARLEWRERSGEVINAVIAEELRRVDLIESEAWGQFERSKLDSIEINSEEIPTESGVKSKKSKKVKGQCGDPRYLEIALKCVEKRMKLLGIGIEDSKSTTDQPLTRVALLEVIVESREQVPHVLNYQEFERLIATPQIDETTTEIEPA